ncbi:phage tail length tape measure family protein [Mesorhizobium sp. M0320]|uniref:phage tail length tape measure family protein n=1 Tax=Mesorhizobium sp. M0320 TaxID=2956936 RepID=UPI00333BAB4A
MAQALGAIGTEETAAAIAREKAAFASNVVAINTHDAALRKVGGSAKLSANQMLNLSRQGNDVVTMFALGAPPMQIFASQAGQIYDALSRGREVSRDR